MPTGSIHCWRETSVYYELHLCRLAKKFQKFCLPNQLDHFFRWFASYRIYQLCALRQLLLTFVTMPSSTECLTTKLKSNWKQWQEQTEDYFCMVSAKEAIKSGIHHLPRPKNDISTKKCVIRCKVILLSWLVEITCQIYNIQYWGSTGMRSFTCSLCNLH